MQHSEPIAMRRDRFTETHEEYERFDRIVSDIISGVLKAESVAVNDEARSGFWDSIEPGIRAAQSRGQMIVLDLR